MLTAAFWKATLERAVRTFAQVLLATLGLDSAGIVHSNWNEGLSLAAGAALLTLLTAVSTSAPGPAGPGLTESVVGASRED